MKSHPRAVSLEIVFTAPGMAVVGKAWKQLEPELESGEVEYGEVSFEDTGRARVDDTMVGKLRVYARRSDRVLLGSEMFAPAAEHLAHLLALAIDRKMTVDELLAMPAYHPTYEEQLKNALSDLLHRLDTTTSDRVTFLPDRHFDLRTA